MKILDIFSGIGGFSIAAHWAGFETAAFCEQDKFCQKVLAKNFPGVPIFDDIKTLKGDMVDTVVSHRLKSNKPLSKEDIVCMSSKRKEIYDHAAKLYDSGMSVQEVADYYGVSRQSMWKSLQRRTTLRPQKRFGEDNNFYRGGESADDKAQNILEKAIKKGVIERRYKCESCGDNPIFQDGRTGIQAHHCDYNKPLDVMWLCQKCHHEWHKVNQPIKVIGDQQDDTNKEGGNARETHSATIDLVCGGFP